MGAMLHPADSNAKEVFKAILWAFVVVVARHKKSSGDLLGRVTTAQSS
jgi:hypothetical protein